jgi:hypothetical protein
MLKKLIEFEYSGDYAVTKTVFIDLTKVSSFEGITNEWTRVNINGKTYDLTLPEDEFIEIMERNGATVSQLDER